ncbi:heparinase [Rhodobacteraceae bacterium KN286]|uniref:Heparinase n=2 Tax=Oceanomicrobium pacificus TaxID=2692916 RepID=A0A6B0TYZ0_9RHOB|nr:heparinase [Oceanomicrobium pacificus]
MGARIAQGWRRAGDRLRARRLPTGPRPSAFVAWPEPRTIGSYTSGLQLLAGNFQFAGRLVEAPRTPIWEVESPSPEFTAEMNGFAWLDDLIIAGDAKARRQARVWVNDWIRRYGKGQGPGWTPELTGRRVLHWIAHAVPLMRVMDEGQSDAFLWALGRQAGFLKHRWSSAPPGPARIAALTGLVYCALALEGRGGDLGPALRALGREAAREVGPDGGIATRNPEELLTVFTLLTWASRTAQETGHQPDRRHLEALARIAPTLRALRLGDGALTRFHGGGRGIEGQLDQTLADAGIRSGRRDGLAMGYAQIAHGRTKIVVDAAAPPRGRASANGHASTLGFEMSSGRRPIIVNCGPGYRFGPDWRRASRATASHSAPGLERVSSSGIAPEGFVGNTFGERLIRTPADVSYQRANDLTGTWIRCTHDGYVDTHGLICERRLFLSSDGRSILGEDRFTAETPRQKARLDSRRSDKAVRFQCHFHVHPDVTAALDLGGQAVSLKLRSEEVWILRQEGGTLSLDASAYLDQTRLHPRATKQAVVSADLLGYGGAVTWSLRRASDGSRATRDLHLDPEERRADPETDQ